MTLVLIASLAYLIAAVVLARALARDADSRAHGWLPLALLALHRLGVINGRTLTTHWRYATVIMAVIAAAMPGADPVSTAFEMIPLVVLYLASIVMLKIADRRVAARAATESSSSLPEGLDPT